ncbi:MAG: LysR family transcriptional regulator, partial [Niameybacter sp.]
TIATLGSITKASEYLHTSQPSLSVQLKKLEDSLGLKLFNKLGNKLFLNDNGQLLFNYTKQIFSLIEDAENKLLFCKETVSGSIFIGGSNTPGAYILPKIIGKFKAIYP